jgi:Tfp pilus assembly protein PilF
MRAAAVLVFCQIALAQGLDPAYEALSRAYARLRAGDYDSAIADFRKGVEAAPKRASIRKDLGYAYLKVGENTLARDQFREAMALDGADAQAAMEYAFLCYETKERAQTRRVFDRIRTMGAEPYKSRAEQAFQNIDAPLAAGIERWKEAIEMGADNFSAHFELATLAEERDELALAAEHYEKAWRIQPDRRSVLVDLGRVWKASNRVEDANAAWLAAALGGETRAAEMARESLPERYPYVAEFRRALELDSGNAKLRRELAYLLLKMGMQPEAEAEFQRLTETAPEDLLSATQLAFLLYGRGERAAAQPLFDRVLAGNDEELANRARAVLRMPQLETRGEAQPASIDAKAMAERSVKAGYMKDALKYLQMAHESDPGDFDVILKLGWTYNILRQDAQAIRWFDLARKSPDAQTAREGARAWRNLHSANELFSTTAWFFPMFSTRWRDVFAYGQLKTELRTGLAVRPYVSLRFIGDTRGTLAPETIGGVPPQYLSESSFILGVGLRTPTWRGVMAWGEAGSAMGYLTGHAKPDYRGGVSVVRGAGRRMGSEAGGWFADTTIDGVFISRFGNDFLMYVQGRLGYTTGLGTSQTQLYWNANLTADGSRQAWANFVEAGPGLRFAGAFLPRNMYFTINALRGMYLVGGKVAYNDFRLGFWYALTR